MRPLPRRRNTLWLLAGIGGALYPVLVYIAHYRLPPQVLVGIAGTLGGVQVFRHRRHAALPGWSLLAIPIVLLGLLALRPMVAAQAYPTLVSLTLAAAFGWSLRRPPSAIERIARLSVPDLPPAGVAYTRGVTKVWIGFFLANAAIATGCAVWGTLALWTLWTGVLSYVAVGALLGGEWLYRHYVVARVPQ